MKKKIADKILAETESGYDLVSDKFSETRKHFWRELEFIGDYAKEGDTVFDFGCGNGRLLELFSGKNINYFGADVSEKLIEMAKIRYSGVNAEFSKINPSQSSLAFPDNYFNTVYSIAVFHHFPGKEYREQVVKELYRITKPGGHVVITVWNLWPASLRLIRSGQAVVSARFAESRRASRGGQRKYIKNIFKNWIDKLLLRSSLDFNDCYITFKNNQGRIFNRYHHAFTGRELANIFIEAGFTPTPKYFIHKCRDEFIKTKCISTQYSEHKPLVWGFKKEALKIGKNIVLIGRK